jgi:SagB-type dehydrogenase family enzyme
MEELESLALNESYTFPPIENIKDIPTARTSLIDVLKSRRSVRRFADKPLTVNHISLLLWSGYGVTQRRSSSGGYNTFFKKTVPSAGATYPLKLYLVCLYGVFEYIPEEHKIIKRVGSRNKGEDKRRELAEAALWQNFIAEAPVSIVIVAIYERTTSHYGKRGIQYVHIEVGHSAQNIHLMCEMLGLGSVAVGAFVDDAVSKVLALPANEVPLYIIPIGYPGR